MLLSRIKTYQIFEDNITELSLGFNNLHTKIGNDDWFHVSRIIHFFEKFCIYYNSGSLDVDLSKDVLDRYFVYWYEKHLKTLAIASLNRDFTEWGGWAKSIKQLGDKLE